MKKIKLLMIAIFAITSITPSFGNSIETPSYIIKIQKVYFDEDPLRNRVTFEYCAPDKETKEQVCNELGDRPTELPPGYDVGDLIALGNHRGIEQVSLNVVYAWGTLFTIVGSGVVYTSGIIGTATAATLGRFLSPATISLLKKGFIYWEVLNKIAKGGFLLYNWDLAVDYYKKAKRTLFLNGMKAETLTSIGSDTFDQNENTLGFSSETDALEIKELLEAELAYIDASAREYLKGKILH